MRIMSWRNLRLKRTKYAIIFLMLLASNISGQKPHEGCNAEAVKDKIVRKCAFKRSLSFFIPTNDISQPDFQEITDFEDGYAEILLNFIRTGSSRKLKSRSAKKKYGLKKRKSKRNHDYKALVANICADPSYELDYSDVQPYCL